MNYKMIFDYHTHTTFSHGKGSIEDNVKVALEKGLKQIAISDHGPGHLTYGIKKDAAPIMRAEIQRLNKIYKDIDIFLSVEANIVNKGNNLDISKEDYPLYDFVIAGYHYGVTNGYCIPNYLYDHGIFKTDRRYKKLCEKNTEMTIKALYENDIRILTHPGDKAPFDIEAISKACAKTNTWMEISCHHAHLTVPEIKVAMKEDVSFVISSDAHHPKIVGTYQGGIMRAKEAGLDLSRIVNIEVK